jgi:hypothetical protein
MRQAVGLIVRGVHEVLGRQRRRQFARIDRAGNFRHMSVERSQQSLFKSLLEIQVIVAPLLPRSAAPIREPVVRCGNNDLNRLVSGIPLLESRVFGRRKRGKQQRKRGVKIRREGRPVAIEVERRMNPQVRRAGRRRRRNSAPPRSRARQSCSRPGKSSSATHLCGHFRTISMPSTGTSRPLVAVFAACRCSTREGVASAGGGATGQQPSCAFHAFRAAHDGRGP